MMYCKKEEFLNGCILITSKIYADYRGYTIKPYHSVEFNKLGIHHNFEEDLLVSSKKGVLRGLHFQNPPYAQSKILCCIKGSIMDVVLDIRVGSPTYGQYRSIILSGDDGKTLFIPEGFAHGYLTIEDDSILMYKMSSVYMPECEDGILWDSAGIPWNMYNHVISERDKSFLPFHEFKSKFTYPA